MKRSDVAIKETIGHGAWAVVSIGVFQGCKVAVKQPHPKIMNESTGERMKREASNMAKMYHPNLVRFIGANFDNSKEPMIVTELMEQTLRVTYEKTVLTKDQMLSIFKDVAFALHYLHEFRESLIHRDLTSSNVLLKSLPGNKYIAKVCDFGSTNLEKKAITSGEGAIVYSSPESFPTSTVKQTVKMDSYSYGILLCEVINRKLPDSDHRDEIVEATREKWESLHGLTLKCIKRDPEERPAMREILNYLSYKVQ